MSGTTWVYIMLGLVFIGAIAAVPAATALDRTVFPFLPETRYLFRPRRQSAAGRSRHDASASRIRRL